MSCYNLQKGFRNNNFQTLTSFCLLGLVKWGFWLELPSHIKWSDKVCSKRNFLNDQHFFHDYHFKVIHDQVFLSVEMFTLTFASQIHLPSKSQIWKKDNSGQLWFVAAAHQEQSKRIVYCMCCLRPQNFLFLIFNCFEVASCLREVSQEPTYHFVLRESINHDMIDQEICKYILQRSQSHLFRVSWRCLKVLLAQAPPPNQTGVPGSQESPKL